MMMRNVICVILSLMLLRISLHSITTTCLVWFVISEYANIYILMRVHIHMIWTVCFMTLHFIVNMIIHTICIWIWLAPSMIAYDRAYYHRLHILYYYYYYYYDHDYCKKGYMAMCFVISTYTLLWTHIIPIIMLE